MASAPRRDDPGRGRALIQIEDASIVAFHVTEQIASPLLESPRAFPARAFVCRESIGRPRRFDARLLLRGEGPCVGLDDDVPAEDRYDEQDETAEAGGLPVATVGVEGSRPATTRHGRGGRQGRGGFASDKRSSCA
jgi:hypothetical protein